MWELEVPLRFMDWESARACESSTVREEEESQLMESFLEFRVGV